MLLSWDCIIKKNLKLAGPPVYYSWSNAPSLAPQFKWLDNTFKVLFPFMELKNRFPAWRASTTTLTDVRVRQATEAGGIDYSWNWFLGFLNFTNLGSASLQPAHKKKLFSLLKGTVSRNGFSYRGHAWSVVGLNRGRGQFLNCLCAPMVL